MNSFGFDTSVMVRSRVLRKFDEQMGSMIQQDMEEHGVHFIERSNPTSYFCLFIHSLTHSITKLEDGRLCVQWIVNNVTKKEDVFDTVLFATGRIAATAGLNLETVNIHPDKNTGKIKCPKHETTEVPNIHVIGDAREGNLELTPVAIKQGKLLANRLFGNSTKHVDYNLVPTTIFTPLEYSSVGLTEEEATQKFNNDIDVYHMRYCWFGLVM